jgi:hypothetical protein
MALVVGVLRCLGDVEALRCCSSVASFRLNCGVGALRKCFWGLSAYGGSIALLGTFGILVLLGGGYGGVTGFRCFGDGAFIDSFF